jgi:integrase
VSVWWDKEAKRYRIRIRRGGADVAREILPAGVTRDQATERHAQLVRDVFDQDRLGKQRHTLAEALKRYAEEEIPRHANPSKTRSVLAVVLREVSSDDDLQRIPDIAQRCRTARASLSPPARNRPLGLLRRVARLAFEEWGWLDKPIKIRLEPEQPRDEYLTQAEVGKLISAARKLLPIAGDWCQILVYTGCRKGELDHLTPVNVRGDLLHLTKTKTRKPRMVPLLPRVQKPLARWIAAAGTRPKERWLYYLFKRAAAAIGRPGLHAHDLRHTTASLLAQAGVDLFTIGEILGSRYAVRRYAHLDVAAKRRAMDRLVQNVTP